MIEDGITGKNGLSDSLAKLAEHHAKPMPGAYPKELFNAAGQKCSVASVTEEVGARHSGFAEKGE